MYDLLDRSIHQAAVQHCWIVASAAPFRRLGANRVLHILDRLAVPLVVERRKMVRRTEPLVVDIFVTALAGIRFHEKLAGNFLLPVNLRGAREKRTLRPIAFAIHVGGWDRRILNADTRLPAPADVMRSVAKGCKQQETNRGAQNRCARTQGRPRPQPKLGGNQKADPGERDQDVQVEPLPFRAWRASLDEHES